MAYEAGAIVEGVIQYVANQQRCMNVVHYRPGTPGVGPVRDLVQGFLTVFQGTGPGTLIAGMRGLMSDQVIIDKVTAQAIYPTRYIKEETEDYSQAGLINVPCEVQNVQLCVTKKGDLANRHNVGHFHLGGLATSVYGGGVINSLIFGAQLGALLSGLEWKPNDLVNGIEYTPVILNKIPVVIDGKTKYIISGGTVQTFVEPNETLRTMRRRTVGLGI